MADNYLETRQAQLSSGKVVYRKDNPSLETLLHKIAQQTEVPAQQADMPAQGAAKTAQLEAIARSARILFPALDFQCDQNSSSISWQKEAIDAERLGAIILAMKLKACELGFRAQLLDDNSLFIYK